MQRKPTYIHSDGEAWRPERGGLMANNYSAASLSAGGTQFFIWGTQTENVLPTAREPSINELSPDCTDATVALFKGADAGVTQSRGEKVRVTLCRGPLRSGWSCQSISRL